MINVSFSVFPEIAVRFLVQCNHKKFQPDSVAEALEVVQMIQVSIVTRSHENSAFKSDLEMLIFVHTSCFFERR